MSNITSSNNGRKEKENSDIAKSNYFPANIYLFKIHNRNNRKRCEICLKLTTKTPEQRH